MAKNALTVNQAMEQLTAAKDDEARAAILNNCTVVQIRRITGELKLSVPGKLRKSELIQTVIQTMHAPEAEAPTNNTPAINSSSTDNPLQDVVTPAPIRAISPLHGNVTGVQLHAAHVHDEQEDVKQIHPLADREKTSRRTNERDGEPWWVAKDVCEILDLANITEALRGLDDDELSSEILKSGGQGREMRLISESGLYTLKHGEIKSGKGTQKMSIFDGKSGRFKFYLGRHVKRQIVLTRWRHEELTHLKGLTVMT